MADNDIVEISVVCGSLIVVHLLSNGNASTYKFDATLLQLVDGSDETVLLVPSSRT
jgi:hypothetical protein